MSDPINFVKSSGGSVDAEFTGNDAVIRNLVDILKVCKKYTHMLVGANETLLHYASTNWYLTEPIPVHGNSVVVNGHYTAIEDSAVLKAHLIFYDANNNIIKKVYYTTYQNNKTEMLPDGTVYIRVQYFMNSLETEESRPEVYASIDRAYLENKKTHDIDFDIMQPAVTPEDTSFLARAGKNMINPAYMYPKGKYFSYGSCRYQDSTTNVQNTRLIPIEPGETYALNHTYQLVFFDEFANFIGGISNSTLGLKLSGLVTDDNIVKLHSGPGSNIVFTAPNEARYISVTVYEENSSVQLEKGSESTAYEPYSVNFNCTAKGMQSIQRVIDVIVPAVMNKKTIKLIGDSITAGVGGTGYDVSANGGGVLLWNDTYTNVKGTCWANMLKSYWEKKYGCTVLNYGYSGIASAQIIKHIDTLVEDSDDVVVCMIGTNDRIPSQNANLAEYMVKMQQIVKLVKSKGKDIVLMANIPASVSNEVDTTRVFHMEDVDNAVAYVAAQNAMEYVSVYKLFTEYCTYTGTSIDSLLSDGLHPNDNGYAVMFELISNALGIATKRSDATW